MFHAAAFNLFSGILYGMAAVAAISTRAYPEQRREGWATSLVFAVLATALLFFP